ncbi:regulator of (H+)-ATPase in vacuolar membrane, partial [Nowakowskiella sp. JEL0078]
MCLLAVIDTVNQLEKQKRSLDENGARFLLAMRMFIFSQKNFPEESRPIELINRDISWAVYSESQDILIDYCNQSYDGKLLWSHARSLGFGYWITNLDSLTFEKYKQMETIARNSFMSKEDKDPVECSLLYLAMRKKNVLLGLWKLAQSHAEHTIMVRFLANDFSEDRWQKAALKNAFVLLGKQRYEYAAAFFLLGDRLKDAVNVCLQHLNDYQLAIVLCRLYQGDNSEVLNDLLTTILNDALMREDRWSCSMIFSLLKQKENSLYSLLMPLESLTLDSKMTASTTKNLDPALLILYNHLRKNFKILRMDDKISVPADVEFRFIYDCASSYEQLGLPSLALQIVEAAPSPAQVLKQMKLSEKGNMNLITSEVLDRTTTTKENDEIDWSTLSYDKKNSVVDWGEPTSQKYDAFDWGAPISNNRGLDDDYDSFRKDFVNNDDLGEQILVLENTESEKIDSEVMEIRFENEVKDEDINTRLQIRHIRLFKWQLTKRIIQ